VEEARQYSFVIMAKKATPKASVRAEARAEVSAAAIVKYAREKKITEHVPEDVTRAKASAWLDLISPLTEWAGLKGDELRHKRGILRIQREESLRVLASQALAKAHASELDIKPLPAKTFVPLLEKASLEEPDSELLSWWSSLLASASTTELGRHPIFSDILAKLTVDEVKELEKLWEGLDVNTQGGRRSFDFREIIAIEIMEPLRQLSVADKRNDSLREQVIIIALNTLKGKGIFARYISYPVSTGRRVLNKADLDDQIIDVCVSSGILRRLDINFPVEHDFYGGDFDFSGEFVMITDLGLELLRACH
jgi:hypothetical protein